MQFSQVLLKVKYAICKQDPDEINLSKWRNYGKIKACIFTFLNIVLRSRLMVADNTRDLSLFLCLSLTELAVTLTIRSGPDTPGIMNRKSQEK